MYKGSIPAEDFFKDPYVLEFTGLPEAASYSGTELEEKIIDHLQQFLLELGRGFTFVGRQVRFTFEEDHYRVGLVTYNREEVVRLSEYFQDLELALKYYDDANVKVDFESSNMFYWRFREMRKRKRS